MLTRGGGLKVEISFATWRGMGIPCGNNKNNIRSSTTVTIHLGLCALCPLLVRCPPLWALNTPRPYNVLLKHPSSVLICAVEASTRRSRKMSPKAVSELKYSTRLWVIWGSYPIAFWSCWHAERKSLGPFAITEMYMLQSTELVLPRM